MSERDHLNAIWRMTKRKPAGLCFPDMPDPIKHVWSWFVQISNAGEVSLTNIDAFKRLKLIDMTQSEIDLILDFDLARRKVQHNQLHTNTPAEPDPVTSRSPATGAPPRKAPPKPRGRSKRGNKRAARN